MTKLITWPEPTHIWAGSGTNLNPERVDGLVREIRQELVLGEQIRLVAELGVIEYMAPPKDDPIVAAGCDLEQSFRDAADQGGMMITADGVREMADTVAALIARLRVETLRAEALSRESEE